MSELIPTLDDLLNEYAAFMQNVEINVANNPQRASGGVQRMTKGKFLEAFAEKIIRRAWADIGGNDSILKFEPKNITVAIKKDYLDTVVNPDVATEIRRNLSDYVYRYSVDIPVYLANELVLAVECKNYTENAMIKRILFDGSIIKENHPLADIVLIQLESQLGGDYSVISSKHLGSRSTHTLMSYYNFELRIITLLEGERNIEKPIHKREHYKDLTKQSLENACETFRRKLKNHADRLKIGLAS